MPEPIVTIIITCHNHRAALWECLYSIEQSISPWPYMVLVVDDTSDDHPEEVCRSFNVAYMRVDCRNPGAARNAGLAATTTEYVIFFDADNKMRPNFIVAHLEPLLDDRADVTYGRRYFISDADESEGFFSVHSEYPLTLEGLKMAPQIDTACAARRSRLTDQPWDSSLGRFEDWDFHLTNMGRGLRYHFIDEPLFDYRVNHYTPNRKYRSEEVNKRSVLQLRHKHQLAKSGRATVTIAIPLLGREYCIRELLDCLVALQYPHEQLNILFIDDSNDMDFWRRQIKPFIREQINNFAGIGAAPMYTQEHFYHLSPDVDEQKQRFTKISQLLRRVGECITTPYVMVLEDDTLCPPDTITKLLAALESDPSNVLAQGIERSRVVKYAVGAWQFSPNGAWQNLYWQRPDSGVTAVGAGGFYCVMARGDWFAAFDFPPFVESAAGLGGPDIACGSYLRETGGRWVTDWGVKCEHVILTPRGVKYSLSVDDFCEPKEVFTSVYLPDEQYCRERIPSTSAAQVKLKDKITLILHQVMNTDQVHSFLHSSGLDADPNLELVIIPYDHWSRERLAAGTFLPGTVLRRPESLADSINQVLKLGSDSTRLVVARADVIPPTNMRLRCETQVCAATPIVQGWLAQELFWDGKRITTERAYHYKQFPHFDLLMLYVPGVIWPWAEPRLTMYPSLLALSFGWQLHSSGKGITGLSGYATTASIGWFDDLATPRRKQLFYYLGILFGMEVPIKRAFTFWRHNVRGMAGANWQESLTFWRGVMVDTKLRLTNPTKRHLR